MCKPQAPRDRGSLDGGEGEALCLSRVPRAVVRPARPAEGPLGCAQRGAEAPLRGVRRRIHPPIQPRELLIIA